MTQDEIKNLATIAFAECDHIPNTKIPKEFVIAFAKLIAAKEREACAKVCEDIYTNGDGAECWLENAAKKIRARGEA